MKVDARGGGASILCCATYTPEDEARSSPLDRWETEAQSSGAMPKFIQYAKTGIWEPWFQVCALGFGTPSTFLWPCGFREELALPNSDSDYINGGSGYGLHSMTSFYPHHTPQTTLFYT